MKTYIIERDIPKVGNLDRQQFKDAAARSNGVLRDLGPDIQWVESYVTQDRLFCVYRARDEEIIRKHAEKSGFPASRIHPVGRKIDPTTAG
jgi:hypothetical protein